MDTTSSGHDIFPEYVQFKYPWRTYQKRVLDELESHLSDAHLHVVAPPGSGKTVLGLEVVVRLNKPSLILTPSIAIRNQWVERFCELFVQTEQRPDWISQDIRRPKFLTVATYQGLHAACQDQDEEDELDEESEDESLLNLSGIEASDSAVELLIRSLQKQNIATIVVDEAHHLKNAWWRSLIKVKTALMPTIVGLTATPPYDVSHNEWLRYIELNGPVDAEITVPELVIEDNLCPHQDYIYLSKPSHDEAEKIAEYRQRIQSLYEEILGDAILLNAIEQHPIFQDPNANLEWIYLNITCYSATLIFLHAIGREISPEHKEIIGDKDLSIPALDYEWMEILLDFYLFKDPANFKKHIEHQEKLINKLIRSSAMERQTIKLQHSSRISKSLSSSISKLDSIEEIVNFEFAQLQHKLRMVVLTDYIHKEFLVSTTSNNLKLNKIGVIPIFEKLRRKNSGHIKIGVLSGSLIIIPKSALAAFTNSAGKYLSDEVSTSVIPYDANYLCINVDQQNRHSIVHIITQIFEQGEIEVLVGTKSLLGEGWDAPSINALILASFVGSYVLSNQMRGRAIRASLNKPDKTSNIWHLACVDPTAKDGGDDIQLMNRRFKAFVGISFDVPAHIENGINRLKLPYILSSEQEIAEVNNDMLSHASRRARLKANWDEALRTGKCLYEEMNIPFPRGKDYKAITRMYFWRTIAYFVGTLGTGVTIFIFESFNVIARNAHRINSLEELYRVLLAFFIAGICIFGGMAFKSLRMLLKHRDITKDIHHIGEALLESLLRESAIESDRAELKVISSKDSSGAVSCRLDGGSTFEKSLFIQSMQEIVDTVDNPRYVILRKSSLLNVISRVDYHSVPDLLARNKTSAEYFERQWRQFVGKCKLIYTRTIEGRKIILRARMHSLAREFEEKSERVNKWK